MEYRKWEKKDITTSLLGFGCMRFTMKDGKIEEEKAQALIDEAYAKGINYFDTAIVYLDGQSEPFLGKALHQYKRDTFYIASKYSLWNLENEEEIAKVIDKQLTNLQTDYIDFYLLHAMNKERIEKIKKYHILDHVKNWEKEGKIRNIGFSFHDDFSAFSELIDLYNWDFCQIQFNYMDKDIQQGMEGYQILVDREIPIIVMEPLKGGSLVNFNPKVAKKFKAYNQDSNAKWAFRWVGSMPGVKVILSGMNEMSQLKENIEIFNSFKTLSPEEKKIVDDVAKELKELVAVGCTQCQYCMPCPAGVNIPGNFKVINNHMMYKNDQDALWYYEYLEKKDADSTICIKCGECLSKCPQHIDIPTELESVTVLIKEIRQQ